MSNADIYKDNYEYGRTTVALQLRSRVKLQTAAGFTATVWTQTRKKTELEKWSVNFQRLESNWNYSGVTTACRKCHRSCDHGWDFFICLFACMANMYIGVPDSLGHINRVFVGADISVSSPIREDIMTAYTHIRQGQRLRKMKKKKKGTLRKKTDCESVFFFFFICR